MKQPPITKRENNYHNLIIIIWETRLHKVLKLFNIYVLKNNNVYLVFLIIKNFIFNIYLICMFSNYNLCQ